MKYTASELLRIAGVEQPQDVIGSVSVRIGGIAVNRPDHVINLQGATEVEIQVANERETVQLPTDRTEPSEEVKTAIKAKGEASTKAFEEKKPERVERSEED